MKLHKKIRKVLLLGSGGLRIGQAGEFDYSGSQAIKALKEEGVSVVLINPNIATIQTSKGLADRIYFLPITPSFVERVIEKEHPQGILLAFGGQTALNCGVELFEKGVLKKYGVAVLGTPVSTIQDTEDRARFSARLKEIDVTVARSIAVDTVEAGMRAAEKIGYPVMIRVAYALGGQGSGVVRDEKILKEKLTSAFASAPQVLIEEYLGGWKEIEYEVVRDHYDNCITVCNMENFDPMGIHTGESIVVAPSQTLTNHEYHYLREIALKTVRHLGVVGECNIQYAFNPRSGEYRVIEINARLSRSSALASKATGYPLAFVAAKLALGKALTDIRNSITKVTSACFEPALDYIVVKVPRWDLTKFKAVHREIGSEMKSVGEIMAIGRTFEEALQKALRMLNIGMYGLVQNDITIDDPLDEMKHPTDRRIFALAEALHQGHTIEDLAKLSSIDTWFLAKLANIIACEKRLAWEDMTPELMREAKRLGFSDRQIARITKKPYLDIRRYRARHHIVPAIKQIDTLAAEYPARTNYLYCTYGGTEHDIEPTKKSALVLGSGPYRIGSSVEFDWCAVNAVDTLGKLGYETIMVNCNPETVSTDYDICDRLYFEELSFERVLDIYEFEHSKGTVLSVGGQMANDLAKRLYEAHVPVFGTSPLSIDRAEDRNKFSRLCDELGIDQPHWRELTTFDEAKRFAKRVGYPILIRPSYVLSGAAMNVSYDEGSLERYLQQATEISKEYPVVISKFIEGAKEIEIDGVAKQGKLIVYALTEHVENAGVHSGDATIVLPPQRLYLETIRRIKHITKKITGELNITGPFNIQFLAKSNEIKVIECNLRASRSFPFVSKATKYNFIDIAMRAMFGKNVTKNYTTVDLDYVVVKVPQFSFSRLKGADPVLSVEMGSTGEVACFGDDIEEAFLKSILATGFSIPKENILVSIGGDENKMKLLPLLQKIARAGYTLFATEHTAEFLRSRKIPVRHVHKVSSNASPNVKDLLEKKAFDLMIVIPHGPAKVGKSDGYVMRRRATDFNIPLISNTQLALLFLSSIIKKRESDLSIQEWSEYL